MKINWTDESEELANTIQQYPCLYDTTTCNNSVLYKLQRQKCWEEIGITLKSNPQACKQRWKSLRDQYVKLLHIENNPKAIKTFSKDFEFTYNKLNFLNPFIKIKFNQKDKVTSTKPKKAKNKSKKIKFQSTCTNSSTTASLQQSSFENPTEMSYVAPDTMQDLLLFKNQMNLDDSKKFSNQLSNSTANVNESDVQDPSSFYPSTSFQQGSSSDSCNVTYVTQEIVQDLLRSKKGNENSDNANVDNTKKDFTEETLTKADKSLNMYTKLFNAQLLDEVKYVPHPSSESVDRHVDYHESFVPRFGNEFRSIDDVSQPKLRISSTSHEIFEPTQDNFHRTVVKISSKDLCENLNENRQFFEDLAKRVSQLPLKKQSELRLKMSLLLGEAELDIYNN